MASGRARNASILVCCVLAALFAWLSYSATLSKSATLDEPLHVASAYAATSLHDYRLDAENPPLWKYLVMLTMRRDALNVDQHSSEWRAALSPGGGQVFATRCLYQTVGNDGIAAVNSARGAMICLGVAVLLIGAFWAYRIAGPAAAIAAATLITLDPTFLAHASIVKNDIAMTLLLMGLVTALSRAWARLTVFNVLAIALACGAAMSVKFSGVLFPMIAVATLLARACTAPAWPSFVGALRTRFRRVGAVIVVTGITAFLSVAIVWSAYGFRYRVSTDETAQLDFPVLRRFLAHQQVADRLDREPTAAEVDAWQPSLLPRALEFIDRHRLMPQAWGAGFLGVIAAMAHHQNYLFGTVKWGGWWYYFPLALIFKTPLATLIGTAAIMACLRHALSDPRARRTLLCIAIASSIYLGSAMTQDINHGIRHLLPVMALWFVAIAVVFSRILAIWRTRVLAASVLIVAALALESLAVYPNYLSFFNIAASRTAGGFALLGDSNLDWGQDLPQLAIWQQQHPRENLYLAYYGAADPATYGIQYTNLSGGFFLGPPPQTPSAPAVIAASATRLQGLYMDEDLRRWFATLRAQTPREILPGGTIYLFDHPPGKSP